jgi:uncharacterized membrane protein
MSDDLAALWSDPKNWNRDGSYNCAADLRLFVPKRMGLGWTLNMAHPRAQTVIWSFLLAVIAFVVVIGLMAARGTR